MYEKRHMQVCVLVECLFILLIITPIRSSKGKCQACCWTLRRTWRHWCEDEEGTALICRRVVYSLIKMCMRDTCTCVYMCVFIYIDIYMYKYISVFKNTYIYMYMDTYTHTYIYMHIDTHTRTHTFTHTHVCTYMYVRRTLIQPLPR